MTKTEKLKEETKHRHSMMMILEKDGREEWKCECGFNRTIFRQMR